MSLWCTKLPRHHAGAQAVMGRSGLSEREREDLRVQLRACVPGLDLHLLPEVGSTNSLLMDRLRAAAGGQGQPMQPSLVWAESQTGGRGRLGRSWHATSGATLTFSLALPLSRANWSGLSLAIGVALAEAIDPLLSEALVPHIGLKWPNDLWRIEPLEESVGMGLDQLPKASLPTRGRKVGGILVETASIDGQRWAVVGVGLNVLPLAEPEGFDLATGSWSEIQPAITVPQALLQVSAPLLECIRQFEVSGFEPWAHRYEGRDVLRGRGVVFGHPQSREGEVLGVNTDGALRVRSGETIESVSSGEVNVKMRVILADNEASLDRGSGTC